MVEKYYTAQVTGPFCLLSNCVYIFIDALKKDVCSFFWDEIVGLVAKKPCPLGKCKSSLNLLSIGGEATSNTRTEARVAGHNWS